MALLSRKILRMGETAIYLEPEIYAIKLSKRANKTPVALIQLETFLKMPKHFMQLAVNVK
jgi:hypothetical protein